MPSSQQGGTEQPETNQQEGPTDATRGKALADYDLDIYYKTEISDTDIKAINKEEENSDAEYAKMELLQARKLHQKTMNCKVTERIERVHHAQGPEIMALWLQDMYLQLKFSPKAARLHIREQGLDSPESFRVLTEKNVNDICNVMRKPSDKNADRTPNIGQQVSVMVQENLKLVIFLLHHWWRCTFYQEVMRILEGTVHLPLGHEKFDDTQMCCNRSTRPIWQD